MLNPLFHLPLQMFRFLRHVTTRINGKRARSICIVLLRRQVCIRDPQSDEIGCAYAPMRTMRPSRKYNICPSFRIERTMFSHDVSCPITANISLQISTIIRRKRNDNSYYVFLAIDRCFKERTLNTSPSYLIIFSFFEAFLQARKSPKVKNFPIFRRRYSMLKHYLSTIHLSPCR